MFVLKSTMQAEIRRLEDMIRIRTEAYKDLCRAYEDRILDLQRLVFPLASRNPDPIALEVDAVISGSEKPVEQSEAERNAFLAGERELDLLISGNYSEDLLN